MAQCKKCHRMKAIEGSGFCRKCQPGALIADTHAVKRRIRDERARLDALVDAIGKAERGECVCETCREWNFECLLKRCEASHADR